MKDPRSKAWNHKYNTSKKGRAAARRYADTNRAKVGKRRRGSKRRKAMVAFLHAMKSRPCMDCGGTFDPVCMDFDHRPGEVKAFGVGNAVVSVSIEALRAEIAKCDIVCANCHRVRTYRQRDHRALCVPPEAFLDPSAHEFDLSDQECADWPDRDGSCAGGEA